MGVGFALVPPTVFSLGAETLGPKSAGTSFGIINTCMSLGSGTGALVVGVVQDLTHYLPYSFLAMAIIEGFAIVVAYFIHLGVVK